MLFALTSIYYHAFCFYFLIEFNSAPYYVLVMLTSDWLSFLSLIFLMVICYHLSIAPFFFLYSFRFVSAFKVVTNLISPKVEEFLQNFHRGSFLCVVFSWYIPGGLSIIVMLGLYLKQCF